MRLSRYLQPLSIISSLDPMDDAVDWVAGFQSRSRLTKILMDSRALSRIEAIRRARRGTYFASIAVDFIEAARTARSHISFLPLYYAYLNLCKLMIACSDSSDVVEGGIAHGVSYNVSQKQSQSLFTEQLKIRPSGVLPALYATLTGKKLTTRRGSGGKRFRRIYLEQVYSRIADIGAEFSECQGPDSSRLLTMTSRGTEAVPGAGTSMKVDVVGTASLGVPPTRPYRLFPQWTQSPTAPHTWLSRPLTIQPDGPFDEHQAYMSSLVYLPLTEKQSIYTVIASPLGSLLFPEEIPIFLALFHLSSIVRYKPRFMDTLRDSDAWPLVLAARRHLLYKGLLLAISFVLQKQFWITRA